MAALYAFGIVSNQVFGGSPWPMVPSAFVAGVGTVMARNKRLAVAAAVPVMFASFLVLGTLLGT